MDGDRRRALAREALDGYFHGPDASVAATGEALGRVDYSWGAILVEGIADQIAIETLAVRLGRDLAAEGITVVPIGGAQAIAHYARRLGPDGDGLALAGFCDADAAETYRRGLIRAGVGQPQSLQELVDHGFGVCRDYLEDDLIRAVGADEVVAVVESQGELGALRTFRKQPQWRGRPLDEQLRRFLGSKARRASRYARLLIEAVDDDTRLPPPLLVPLHHLQPPPV